VLVQQPWERVRHIVDKHDRFEAAFEGMLGKFRPADAAVSSYGITGTDQAGLRLAPQAIDAVSD
jgi:hypothetical protein